MNAFASIGRLRYCKISEEDGLPDSEVSQKQQNDSKVGPLWAMILVFTIKIVRYKFALICFSCPPFNVKLIS